MSLTDFTDNFRYNVGPDVFLQIVIGNNTEDCFSADRGWGQFCNDGLYFLTYGTTKSTETAPVALVSFSFNNRLNAHMITESRNGSFDMGRIEQYRIAVEIQRIGDLDLIIAALRE